ncbi:MAG TPA: TIGR04053 family radical SAM/SPASM domain-containing protein [Candidatus Binatia bacterium]|nr:TIGR04053 family radical SAM/SPASM domain-containing protein [Candidatus Binatia bacterium]
MQDDFEQSPRVAIWEVTRACDLACRHCRACAIPRPDPAELTTAEGFDLIEQLVELAPGVVVLTGGDPLKRRDLFTLILAAVRRGLTVAITPSVTPLLTADAIAHLARAGISRVALSLDGPDAATHDTLRGTPGSFLATHRAIAAVRAAGLPLQVNTSLTRATAGALPAMLAHVAAIAPVLWSVFFVVPVGRATAAQQLDAEECERIFAVLADWSAATGLPVKTTAAPAFRRVLAERAAASAAGRAGRRPPLPAAVTDGRGIVFVSHTGAIQPSGFLPLVAGNVRWDRLAAVYRTGALFRALRDDGRLGGKCGRCAFRRLCGGSRARAFAVAGDAFAEDPACAYQPPAR